MADDRMGEAPAIKGVLLSKLVDDVRALLERSEADREDRRAAGG